MPYGYNGRILRVDLTIGEMKSEEHGEIVCRTYLKPPLLAFHAENLSTGPAIIDSKQ
jgi:aldehyde:ferredoxin oxidoreductase